MPKIIRKSIIIFLIFFIESFTIVAVAVDVMDVDTGDSRSASWAFTVELSRLWKQQYPDSDSVFAPHYVEHLNDRFINLEKQTCKFVIAPVKLISELPSNDLNIKIAAVLWEVYLIPIDIGKRDITVALNSHGYWFVPESAFIIPSFVNMLERSQNDQSSDMDADDKDQINNDDSNDTDLPARQSMLTSFGNTMVDNTDDTSLENTLFYEKFSGRIIQVHNESIPEFTTIIHEQLSPDGLFSAMINDGILFYEMLGPLSRLLKTLGRDLKPVGLENDFITLLMDTHPLLDTFHLTRRRIHTVSLTMALFVHEFEEPEFVKNIIELIVKQPESNFAKSYIMRNLSIQRTKRISPLFLHDASIQYFNVD